MEGIIENIRETGGTDQHGNSIIAVKMQGIDELPCYSKYILKHNIGDKIEFDVKNAKSDNSPYLKLIPPASIGGGNFNNSQRSGKTFAPQNQGSKPQNNSHSIESQVCLKCAAEIVTALIEAKHADPGNAELLLKEYACASANALGEAKDIIEGKSKTVPF